MHRVIRHTSYFLLLLSSIFLFLPHGAQSRQSVFSGSMQTGIDFWNREYDLQTEETEKIDNEKQYWNIKPGLSLVSSGLYDSITLEYAPTFKYESLASESDIDHSALLKAAYAATKYWTITAQDQLLNSDNPAQPADTPEQNSAPENIASAPNKNDKLSHNQGRTRFWTNKALLETTLIYAMNSQLTFGYNYDILRSDEEDSTLSNDINDYDKHDLFASTSYSLNSLWKTDLGFHYIQGIYEDEKIAETTEENIPESENNGVIIQDFEEYRAGIQLFFLPSLQQSWSLLYSYQETNYEDEQNQNTSINNVSAGWFYSLDPRTSFFLNGGVSYIEIEEQTEQWGYNASLGLDKKFMHGNLNITAGKQYDTSNFTGTDNYGLTDTYVAKISGSYQFSQELSLFSYCSYQDQENLTPQGERRQIIEDKSNTTEESDNENASYNTNRYEAGMNINYAIFKWLTGSIQYSYSQQTGDLEIDSYTDQTIMIQLTGTKDLWHW